MNNLVCKRVRLFQFVVDFLNPNRPGCGKAALQLLPKRRGEVGRPQYMKSDELDEAQCPRA